MKMFLHICYLFDECLRGLHTCDTCSDGAERYTCCCNWSQQMICGALFKVQAEQTAVPASARLTGSVPLLLVKSKLCFYFLCLHREFFSAECADQGSLMKVTAAEMKVFLKY